MTPSHPYVPPTTFSGLFTGPGGEVSPFSLLLLCHQTRQVGTEKAYLHFLHAWRSLRSSGTSSPPLPQSGDWSAGLQEQSLSFRATVQSGRLLPGTYVSPLDRQSLLVYTACTQRRVPHTDTVTGRQGIQLLCRLMATWKEKKKRKRKNEQRMGAHANTKLTYACLQ